MTHVAPETPDYAARAQQVVDLAAAAPDPNAVVVELIRRLDLTVLVSVSGGKDSTATLGWIVDQVGAAHVHAHLQVLATAWPDELPYVQEVCRQLGVPLVAQQIVYEPKPGSECGIRRREIRDIYTPADIVPWDQEGTIACLTDFFARRGWPPSQAQRWCTGKWKTALLDAYARPAAPREGTVIADVSDLALRRGWPPSQAQRFCTSSFKRDLLTAYGSARQEDFGRWVIVALGERGAESARRARKPVLSFRGQPRRSYAFLNWLPIHGWSRRDAFRAVHEHGLRIHPAYAAQGMTMHECLDVNAESGARLSCLACIFATEPQVCAQMEDLAHLPVLARLAEVEQRTGRTWWPRGRRSASELLVQLLERAQEQEDDAHV